MNPEHLPLAYDLGAFVGQLDLNPRDAIRRGHAWLDAMADSAETEGDSLVLDRVLALRRGLNLLEGWIDARGWL